MENNDDVLDLMIEIELPNSDAFLIIKETLTRIGVASIHNKTLTQTCHILHKRGRYYITHFKLLFELDGKTSNFDKSDEMRMNTIASLLESWKLCTIIDKYERDYAGMDKIAVVPASAKHEWTLVSKHRIGRK